jgi:hypothetical protein
VTGFPEFSSDPVVLAEQIAHYSRLALTPWPPSPPADSDALNYDLLMDARAEAIHPDAYPPLDEDLVLTPVLAGSLHASANQPPSLTPPPPAGGSAANPSDASSPRGSNARAA